MRLNSISTKIKRRIWIQTFGTDSWVNRTGDFRTRESYGLISRANYVYGMLRAADCAKYFGHTSVAAVEMGVASGGGLLNMIEAARLINQETGVAFRIVGFDTGKGLPSIRGHKDHPEIWNPGDFAMEERDVLLRKVDGRAEIIWGDIEETIDPFTASLKEDRPLGFVSIDVDIYSATKSALRCLTGSPDKYLPGISMYFDDVSFFFANRWCGELAAIEEFNADNAMRKIGSDRSLPGRRPKPAQNWYSAMHVCHILDHPARQGPRQRQELAINAHAEFMAERFLF